MSDHLRFAVIGAGHGGRAMAAHLALMGFETTLFNRTFAHIEIIKKRGGIDLESYESGPNGFANISLVTDNLEEALNHANVIMIVVPSSAHAEIAQKMSKHLKDGQTVILHPGRTLGAIEFNAVMRKCGCEADINLAETETFIYASRADGPAQSRIFRIKEAVPLAALPASRTQDVLNLIKDAYPQFIDGVNVLHTGLNNMGAIFHPALTILNAGWIEATHGDFQFYLNGVTPSVSRVLEELDRERVTVASALGIRARTAQEWLELAYNVSGDTLHESILNQTGYYGIKAPATLSHRYIFEDVPMSLVPIAALGERYGVSTAGIGSIIRIACLLHRTDYWRRGRTLQKLEIKELSVSELTHYVTFGWQGIEQ